MYKWDKLYKWNKKQTNKRTKIKSFHYVKHFTYEHYMPVFFAFALLSFFKIIITVLCTEHRVMLEHSNIVHAWASPTRPSTAMLRVKRRKPAHFPFSSGWSVYVFVFG